MVEYAPRGRTDTLASSSGDATPVDTLDRLVHDVATRSFPTVRRLTFGPITSPRGVRVGDRVRITNRLNHVNREPTEQDRLAAVTKVKRIMIQLATDTGHRASRIRSNLEIVVRDA